MKMLYMISQSHNIFFQRIIGLDFAEACLGKNCWEWATDTK